MFYEITMTYQCLPGMNLPTMLDFDGRCEKTYHRLIIMGSDGMKNKIEQKARLFFATTDDLFCYIVVIE